MSRQIKTMQQLKDSRLLYDKKLPKFGYIIILIVIVLLAVVVIWSMKTPKTYIVHASGIVESNNKNYIMSPYTGKVSEMYIREGSLVQKGEVLFIIESTEMNLQMIQLKNQKVNYETRISQYEKLVTSIKDDKNYFDIAKKEDTLYYSQFEAYKSQVAQNQADISTYKAYGYTEEQIENQLKTSQAKITEIYYSAISTAEMSIAEARSQVDAIDAQVLALEEGQGEYSIVANESGVIHMMSDYDEGMVVQASSPIASIASQQDDYNIIAYVEPSDMVRTQVGDQVDIAVAGLAQSIYGTISGRVTAVDSDITTAQGSENGQSTSYFKIYIKPDMNYIISKEGSKAVLSNGMAVDARIQYDEVTYFDYVMEALGVLTR